MGDEDPDLSVSTEGANERRGDVILLRLRDKDVDRHFVASELMTNRTSLRIGSFKATRMSRAADSTFTANEVIRGRRSFEAYVRGPSSPAGHRAATSASVAERCLRNSVTAVSVSREMVARISASCSFATFRVGSPCCVRKRL